MLFNSSLFVVAFLPLFLAAFALSGWWFGPRAALSVLLLSSLIFYGWWKPIFLPLLIGSIIGNYLWVRLMRRTSRRKPWLIAGLAANLALLGWFKYAGLFAATGASLFGARPPDLGIILPLGISFFTFQQIMYLVDSYRDETPACGFIDYACFVGFFAHLLAGPIVRPREIIPQFARHTGRIRYDDLIAGIEIFLLGLAKKLVLADSLARFADPGFRAAAAGHQLSLVEAWVALLAYGAQIYFDFSGYSDMAIGLARMIGIRFPLNFRSPYQARDISDFWRRWNITLSGFLRDYLYIPLGGNRHGEVRRNANLMITMLLGGFWHGAAWSFLAWGGLHGFYLIIHQQWRRFGAPMNARLAQAITLIAVLVAWVPFRAESIHASWIMLRGLTGAGGVELPDLIVKALPFLRHIATPVAVLPYLGAARTMSVVQSAALLVLAWGIILIAPDIHSLRVRGRNAALIAGFAFTAQALFFAPFARPFIYFQF
ncbi:MBOAT family O-acyltransferase [Acidiphilium sp.]|uniref:MBOAT family O-acyltransferase n=1 Tax=Acidiphilium sp. TaxID=527 RepID=UPI003D008A73